MVISERPAGSAAPPAIDTTRPGARYRELFEPLQIGTMHLRNRIVLTPTSFRGIETSYDPGQGPGFGKARIDTYVAQARGGVGLIIMEDSFVNPIDGGVARPDLVSPQHPAFDRDVYLPALAELVNEVHAFGAKIVPELAHLGRGAVPRDGSGPISASAQPNTFPASFVMSKWIPTAAARAASLEEIAELHEMFAVAAYRAKRARFDGVVLDGHHGGLIAQFLSPMTNKRTDAYGGSLENRMRFALELVERTRERVGPDFPIMFALSGDELTEGGQTIAESVVIAQELERAGICGLFVAPGILFPFPGKYKVLPPMGTPEACYADIAHAIKKAVGIPVIVNGMIKSPDVARKLIVEGKADLIGLARALIADPEWPNKVRQGRIEDIVPCISCTYCSETMQARQNPRCTVNYDWGKSPEPITRAATRKTVVVIGGGPAGMEAARVAFLRGHDVHLLERSDRLGGQLNMAHLPPGKFPIKPYLEWLVRQVQTEGVDVHLGTEASVSVIRSFHPDTVVMATGGTIEIPTKARNGRVVTAWDVLLGSVTVGANVVIVGGGATGCETGEHLLGKGKDVTIIEMQAELAPDMVLVGAGMRYHMLLRLERSKARILTETRVVDVDGASVVVEGMAGARETLTADTIVWAAGVAPRPIELGELETEVEVFRVGDCVRPRNMLDAIWEGSRIARAI